MHECVKFACVHVRLRKNKIEFYLLGEFLYSCTRLCHLVRSSGVLTTVRTRNNRITSLLNTHRW